MTWSAGVERRVVDLGSSGYPAQLAMIPNPPQRLFVIGRTEALAPSLAVIGARKATPYGLAATEMLAGWAADAGYIVTSGAAIGCDQAAHRAALDRSGTTVAVLAGGADVAYPRSATSLLGAIVRSGGAVVSEHPWGVEPRRWAFNTRNRIIAGLANALLVIEAALPSGTFTTADYAIDAGREVFAVPGSIYSNTSRGTNRLICQGAVPVTDPTDLATRLEMLLGAPRVHWSPETATQNEDDPLLSLLRADPVRPEDAARSLGTDIISIARRIGALETSGLVERFPDGRYGAMRRYNTRDPR